MDLPGLEPHDDSSSLTSCPGYDHASNMEWGTQHGEIQTGEMWSKLEALNHINCLELLAAHLEVQYFVKQQCNITMQLWLDNVTAVTYIHKMGGTHSYVLCDLAIQMWEWSMQQNVFFSAEHLPRKENVIADEESRDRCDWMLNPQVFDRIQSQISPCKIDLFASQAVPEIFQLEARPRGGENGCIQPGLVNCQGVCQSPPGT